MVAYYNKHGKLSKHPLCYKPKEVFVEQANEIWNGKFDYTDSNYTNNKEPIIIYCPKHDYHFTVSMAQNHIKKHSPTGCPICAAEKLHNTEYGTDWQKHLKLCTKNNRVGKIENTRHTPEESARRKAERAAKFAKARQKRKEERQRAYQERLAAKKAETRRRHEEEKVRRQAEREQKKRQRIIDLQERFRQEAPKAQGKGYQYRGIENVTTLESHVDVHCPNPEHQWHPMRVDLILKGCKCRECAGRHQAVEQRRAKFLKDFHKKHGHNHYDVMADDYVNNDTPIRVHCKIHNHDFMTAPDNILRGGGGCPYCSSSEGEAIILGWLDNHEKDYAWHYRIPNEDPTLPLQYIEADFYLTNVGLQPMVIEYNGEQHYKNIPFYYKGKRARNFDVQQHRDNYLRCYCSGHHIRLLEISYLDLKNIDVILQEAMKECLK